MLILIPALALTANVEAPIELCSDYAATDESFTLDVCDEALQGDVAYSATIRASLNPEPAVRQVTIFRHDGQWFVRATGYRWEPGTSLVSTRRNELPISADDAALIEAQLGAVALSNLAAQPYYGDDDRICTDGANFELAAAIDGQRHTARQHSCAGNTQLTEITALFLDIAIRYDNGFEGYLGGL
ncbi:hypothetical protein [Aurantiacibacter gangjinensis]|uniref:Uncharacterized protein n=1 Tax=Aurantiacibacter gangjinensis TaxID=502682 RepID=A0A0G9MMB3_9SPHN|nr:hypothetical protein [Aurantiacibacter gangjinensis]APE27752.1 hypothetical protein BMF35_a0923 [Aurantiacibacter gangjinensis]KLE31749.1 hypothetical protein AAW01_09595 [Aurantiacibacter gangjinensis]